MTKILMLQTRKGTEDGFTVNQYTKGEIYDVREGMARQFYRDGWAERAPLETDNPSGDSNK